MTEKIRLLIVAMRDKRTPWYAKAIVVFTLAYIISPIDLIPDFIPVFGLLDEVILIPIVYSIVIRLIPEEVKQKAMTQQKVFETSIGLNVLGTIIVVLCWAVISLTLYFLYKNV